MIGADAAAWLAAAGSLAAMVAIPVLGILGAREWAAMRRRAAERAAAEERRRLQLAREYAARRNGRAERPERAAADEFPMAEGGQ